MKKTISLFVVFLSISSISVFGADLPTSQLPSPQVHAKNIPTPDGDSRLILRDTEYGLGIGTLVGLSFIAMAPGGFSPGHAQLQASALGTGMFVGLAGGLLAGLWQVKKNKYLKLSAQPGDFKTQPASMAAGLAF